MLPKGANLQKIRDGKRTYAITPHVPGGFIKPELLRKYADVAEKYHGTLKMTSAQRMMIIGLQAEDVEAVWAELGLTPAIGHANCVRSIKMCPGSAFCKRGKADSIKLGMELDRLYHKQEMPSRLKMGVAGCQNSCAEVHIKDIGLMAGDLGWDVYVGGSAGAHPRLAQKLIEALSMDEALAMVASIIACYKAGAAAERLGAYIDRIGFKAFKMAVLAHFYQQQAAVTAAAPTAAAEPATAPTAPAAAAPGSGSGLQSGQPITADSIISEIIQLYPQTIPVLRSFGMGCLGCPSATGEPVHKAADIHGLDVEEVVTALNAARVAS